LQWQYRESIFDVAYRNYLRKVLFFSESGENPDYPPGDCHGADTNIQKWVYRAMPGFEIGNGNQQPDDRHHNCQAHPSRKLGNQPSGTRCGWRQRLLSGQ